MVDSILEEVNNAEIKAEEEEAEAAKKEAKADKAEEEAEKEEAKKANAEVKAEKEEAEEKKEDITECNSKIVDHLLNAATEHCGTTKVATKKDADAPNDECDCCKQHKVNEEKTEEKISES